MFKVDELIKATKGKLVSGKVNTQVSFLSTDSRTIKPKEGFIAIKGDNFNGHDFINNAISKGSGLVITEPQTKNRYKAYALGRADSVVFLEVRDTIKALGDIAAYQREKFDIPVIAVTGSNGKTTTKEMIAWVLSRKFNVLKNDGTKNNHIGLPQTLLKLDKSYDFAVLEMGTNHFGEIEYLAKIARPNIGVITNIGPSHLEFFKNLEGVFKEKFSLMKYLKEPCIGLLNTDDKILKKQIDKKRAKPVIFGFGVKNKTDFFASGIRNISGDLRFMLNGKNEVALKTPGVFNIYNSLAAISIGYILGMDHKDIACALSTFNFPQGRLTSLEINNMNFIDDSYNSNPLSLRQALDALSNLKVKGRKIFVMGDMLELGKNEKIFHRKAGEEAAMICDVFITVGRLSKIAASRAKEIGFDGGNIFTCESSQEAKDVLFNIISPSKEDVVLIKGSRSIKMESILKL